MNAHRPDNLEQLLRGSRPQQSVEEATGYATHSRSLAHDIVQLERQQGARRVTQRRRRLIGIAAAAAVPIPSTAWAAGYLAQTGWFGAPGMTENDTSEWIDVCAADFPEYFAAQIPVPTEAPPSGWTWQEIGQDILAAKQSANATDCARSGVNEQVTGLTASYYLWAQDTWMCRAVEAHEAGDEAAFRSNAALAAGTMDRLLDLGVYGDEAWRPIRDGLVSGDVDVVKEFYDVTDAAGGCK